MVADFRFRFWVSLVLTLPVLALSPMLQSFVGLKEVLRFPGDPWELLGLSSAVFFYGGWPFLKGLIKELSDKSSGIVTLVDVGADTGVGEETADIISIRNQKPRSIGSVIQ